MKLQAQRTFVKVEGEVETIQFKVQMNKKLIEILSNKIYTEPILAIVRELSANAWDAHKVNGNENKPFDIKLPTYFDNNFCIRDYGTGISPENVLNVYTIYGVSDKEHTDELIGALGLGSKTIFSYNTKSATIENFYAGKHYIYSAYIGEDGLPNLTLMSTTDSTEPTGLKVTLPCSQHDVGNWQNACTRVYMWYEVKPNFIGTKVSIPEIKTTLESKENNWQLRAENYHLVGAYAVMGKIAYPINFDDTNLKQTYKDLMKAPINLHFNIGDLDIGAGRESLSYDARTKSKITSRLAQICDELNSKVEKDVTAATSLFDARTKVAKVIGKLPSHALQKIIDLSLLKFNNQPIFDKTLLPTWHFNIDSSLSCRKFEVLYNNKLRVFHTRHNIDLSARFVFFEADLKTGNQNRVREFYESKLVDYDYIVLFYFKDAQEKQKLLDFLGANDSHFIKCSTLPKSATISRTGGGGVNTTSKVMLYRGNSRSVSFCWDKTTIDYKKDTGIYVEFNKFRFKNNVGNFQHPKDLQTCINSINELGATKTGFVKIDKVYGIKSALITKLDKKSWKNLFDVIPALINDFVKDNDFLSARELRGNSIVGGWNTLFNKYLPSQETLKKIKSHLTPLTTQHPFIKDYDKIDELIGLYDKYLNSINAFDALVSFCPNLKISPVKVENPKDIELKLHRRYPLLPYLDYSTCKFDDVAQYLVKMEK